MIRKALQTAVLAVTAFSIAGLSSAQTTWKKVSSFTFDWNGRKDVQVVLEIPASWSDPGNFTRIRIRVPGQEEFTAVNENGWVKYGSDEAGASPEIRKVTNLTDSQHVLALKAADKRTLLFLLGYSYASSPGSLDVLELADDGHPRVVLHREEFGLLDLRDLDGDGVAEIIGYPCLSEEFGNGLETYDPLNVYRLGTTIASPATLSVPLSKSYNLKHYYGWGWRSVQRRFRGRASSTRGRQAACDEHEGCGETDGEQSEMTATPSHEHQKNGVLGGWSVIRK